jgi:hypothetical protein
MYTNINELYKNITDLDKSNGLLKNYYMLPGFNIIESNNISSGCDTLNNTSILIKDNSVINDKLFMKFLGFFDNTNNHTQRAKSKLSKKQEKLFTRKQKQKQKLKIEILK